MIRLHRPPCPEFLRVNGPRWAAAFANARKNGDRNPFRWREFNGQPVNRLIYPILGEMTSGHCAYCDHFELGAGSRETIYHFKPKSTYPLWAYTWENLFPACDACQSSRLERYGPSLLRPDSREYDFHRFFVVNYATGRLDANPAAHEGDKRRARKTIALFGLNRPALVSSRYRAIRQYPVDSPEPINQRPFRFLWSLLSGHCFWNLMQGPQGQQVKA
jgi:uncharacterized protein (TIGR02646 family)